VEVSSLFESIHDLFDSLGPQFSVSDREHTPEFSHLLEVYLLLLTAGDAGLVAANPSLDVDSRANSRFWDVRLVLLSEHRAFGNHGVHHALVCGVRHFCI